MKFRATLRDVGLFQKVCSVTRSFSKDSLLRLAPDTVRVVARTPDTTDGAQLWASVNSDALFSDLRIESKQDNAIWCEVPDTSLLVHALQSGLHSSVVVKLAKVGSRQMLCVSVQGMVSGHDTAHEVPIRVLTDTDVQRITTPALEDTVAVVTLPPIEEFMAFVDGAKSAGCLTCQLTLTPAGHGAGVGGTGRGEADAGPHEDDLLADGAAAPGGAGEASLALSASNATMTLEAFFARVRCPPGATLGTSATTVMVSMRRLGRMTSLRDCTVVAHLSHKRVLVLQIHLSAAAMIILYLPAVHA